jgi:excisionase family DNA binding protein
MTNRRPIGEKVPTANASGEDDFTRLVRVIARQAAQQAFGAFRDALETRLPSNPPDLENRSENTVTKTDPPPEPGERFLSVAAVAATLGVSGKTVRRMIKTGDLRAHRVGRLVRVAERSLADCLNKSR